MKIYLIPKDGSFYKANLHCHTNISDGTLSPEEVKDRYKALGYSAVCYTDHEVLVDHKDLCDEDFIALHGYEVAIKKDLDKHTGYFMPVYHFNFISESQDNLYMPKFFKNNPSVPGAAREWIAKCGVYDDNDTIESTEYSIEWLNGYLSAVRDRGFLITYNHPHWSLQNATDYLGLEGLHAIEAINGGCINHGDATAIHLMEMLRHGMKVIPVAGDDNHGTREIGLAWTMIKAPRLTYSDLIAAYKKGDCYASTGAEITELYVEDGVLHISVAENSKIALTSEGRYISVADSCKEAEFTLYPEKMGSFFKLTVNSEGGGVAFTRAYYFDEIR